MKQLFSGVRGTAAKTAAAAAAVSVPALSFAEGNAWDGAITALNGLIIGVAAVGAVAISITVAVISFVIVKSVIKKAV